jgi:ribonuclease Z
MPMHTLPVLQKFFAESLPQIHARCLQSLTAAVVNEANVKELVLYHLVPAPPNKVAEWVFMRGVNNVRSSGVTVGYDGLTYILPIDSKDIYQEDLNDRN